MDNNSTFDLGAGQDQQQRSSHGHDTHAMPPQGVCDVYKHYQKMSDADVDKNLEVVDFKRGRTKDQLEKLHSTEEVSAEAIEVASREFLGIEKDRDYPYTQVKPCTIYTHVDFPGKARTTISFDPIMCLILQCRSEALSFASSA